MPYKDKKLQSIAVQRSIRKYRSRATAVRGISSFAALLTDFLDSESGMRVQGEPVTVSAVLQLLRPLILRIDTFDAVIKRFEETMEAFEKMKESGTKEKQVDHETIDAPEYEMLCPKHGRVRRADRMDGSCC